MKHLWCMQLVTPCWWLSCWCFFLVCKDFLARHCGKCNEMIKMSPEGTPKTGKEERPPAAAREGAEKLLAKARAIFGRRCRRWLEVFFYKITRTFQYLHAKPEFVLFSLKKSKWFFLHDFQYDKLRKALHLSIRIHRTPPPYPNWLEAILVPSQPTQVVIYPTNHGHWRALLLLSLRFPQAPSELSDTHCHSAFLPRGTNVALK